MKSRKIKAHECVTNEDHIKFAQQQLADLRHMYYRPIWKKIVTFCTWPSPQRYRYYRTMWLGLIAIRRELGHE